jgi:hypothetical protein
MVVGVCLGSGTGTGVDLVGVVGKGGMGCLRRASLPEGRAESVGAARTGFVLRGAELGTGESSRKGSKRFEAFVGLRGKVGVMGPSACED